MGKAALIAIAAAGLSASAWGATDSRRATVPCTDIIGQAATGRDAGYRIVLGIVSVPPARLTQVVATSDTQWPFWRKAGLVIRASSTPVIVSVPPRWRGRGAITWGNNSGIVSSLRIAACPRPRNRWNAYAGGFYLRSRAACIPLTFRVGSRARTVRFAIGGPC
jgi:hypothetical protein